MTGHGTMAFKRLRAVLAAAGLSLLAGCAVYPDEVSDGYGGAYFGGGFYSYPGHYYSYYPGYYAYCPPVHVPRHYWSHWRKHRHWPDGWNHGNGRHEHAGGGRGDRDRIGYKGKPNNPQVAEADGYLMPRLAGNPAQVRGQFNRAHAAARHEWAASRAEGGDGGWRGADRKADRAVAKAERRADRAAARGSGNHRSDGGSRASGAGGRSGESSYRGSSGGSGSQGWSGGSRGSGGGSRGGGEGRGR